MTATCFMLERRPDQVRYLRRFTYGKRKPCPELPGGHEAWAKLDVVEDPTWDLRSHEAREELMEDAERRNDLDELRALCVGDLWPHDDERWPEVCAACGYPFEDADEWQLHNKDLWEPADPSRAPAGLELTTLQSAPPGAMYDAWWSLNIAETEDGLTLRVVCPDGTHWNIDGPASQGGAGWERTGTPPRITVNPSIATPGYHGYLVEGEFTEDLEGKSHE